MKHRKVRIRRFIICYIISFSLLTSIAVTAFAYYFGLSTIQKRYSLSYVQATVQSFEASMDHLVKNCNLMLLDLTFNTSLLKTVVSIDYDEQTKNEIVQDLLEKVLVDYEQLRQISILSPTGSRYTYTAVPYDNSPELPMPKKEFLERLSNRGLSLYENCIYDQTDNPYIVFGRDSNIGSIVLYLDESYVSSLYESHSLMNSLLFLEYDDVVLSCSVESCIGMSSDLLESNKELFGMTQSYHQKLSIPALEQTMELTYLIAESDFHRTASELNILLLVALCVVVIICVMLVMILSKHLLKNIDSLKQNLAMFSRDYTHIFSIDKGSELNELEQQFVAMSEQIRLLIQRIEVEQEEKTAAELKALQSQINPHFVYNSIDALNWMAKLQKPYAEIENLACQIGIFFRLGLHNGDHIVTVAEELKHVKTYLEIEMIRFPGTFEYEIQADSSLLDLRIVKITLQPLAENAVNHGFKGMDRKGKLLIRVFETGEQVCFEVDDNGKGTQRATDVLPTTQTMDSGYGLGNVNRRLIMEYGQESALHFVSRPGIGTRVSFSISRQRMR